MDDGHSRKRAKTDTGWIPTLSSPPRSRSSSVSSSSDSPPSSPRSRSNSSGSSSRSPSPEPRPRASATLSTMSTASPRSQQQTAQPRSSARVQQKQKEEMDRLMGAASKLGTTPVSDTSADLTPLLLRPLAPGADNRGYVSTTTRRDMERTIEKTKRTVSTTELPPVVSTMLSSDKVKRDGYARTSSRSRVDGFKSGDDYTMTINTGKPSTGKREASDTPAPRSPHPSDTGEAMDGRYEQAHQSAYQFTRAPGTTVHAPTQANQVADTMHERHAASQYGGFVYRHDTYTTTRMISGKPVGEGQYEVYDSTYRRRKDNSEPKDGKPGSG